MLWLVNNGRRRCWLTAVASVFFCIAAGAQPFLPGQTYFGRSNYIEYIAGNLPVIVSAPHGGSLTPTEMPNRTNATTVNDGNTQDLVRKVRTEIQNLTGHVPHIIINRLDRNKIDCNREIVEGAQGDPEAEIAWNEFQNFIIASRTNTAARHGHGFYIDLHGHGHDIQRLELGYLLSAGELGLSDGTLNSAFYENQSSIRTLSQQSPLTFPALLRGSNSFGALIVAEGYPAVPSPSDPDPAGDDYFNGGYNTVQHSSVNGGTISGLQIESNMDGVRDTSGNRTAYAQALARVLEKYFALHYGVNLRTCLPKIWDGGSGNWGSTGSWYDGVLPVSTNLIVFVGAGGTSTHNLGGLTTGTGYVSSLTFSNAPTGSYTVTGNAFSILQGITNDSGVTQTINNHITLVSTQTFTSSAGTLVIGGNITNAGNQLRCSGNLTINGLINGSGGLMKVGAGALALTAVNPYSGATTNASGVISINGTATFGDGTGWLVLSGGDLLCKNTRSGAPIANPILLAGSSTISGDGTLTNSLRILPFSSSSLTTASGTLTLRHSGTNAFASNNVFRVRFMGGGLNFTRPITLGFIGDLPATQTQLESYNDAGDQTFTGNISGTGQFRRDATNVSTTARTILNGVNSYSGGTVIAAGTLLVNNPFGSGTGSGFVAVSNNGTLGGSGTIAGPVTCAGLISAGQSAGTLTFDGGLDLSAGGTNVWELAALSEAGEGANFDQLVLTAGNLTLGGSAKLQLSFIGAATPPVTTNAFWQGIRLWKIISLTGAATNSGATRFPTIVNGTFAAGVFTNYADVNGNVWLKFIPPNAYTPPVIEPLVSAGTTNTTISWSAVVGQTYEVRFKDDLDAGDWALLGSLIATNNPATLVDPSAHQPQRFYRVVIP